MLLISYCQYIPIIAQGQGFHVDPKINAVSQVAHFRTLEARSDHFHTDVINLLWNVTHASLLNPKPYVHYSGELHSWSPHSR